MEASDLSSTDKSMPSHVQTNHLVTHGRVFGKCETTC